MRQQILAHACAALLVGTTLLDSAGAQTLHVPGDHATIQDALAVAVPGTTIEVGPGHYTGSLLVTVPGITLVGDGALLDPEYTGHGIEVRADDVTIRAFTIANAETGILATASADDPGTPLSGLSLVDNHIVACNQDGIQVEASSVHLRGNRITDVRSGIVIDGLAPATDIALVGNHVEGASHTGIRIEAAAVQLTHNRVQRCESAGMDIDLGLAVTGTPPSRLLRNHVGMGGGDGTDGDGLDLDAGTAEVFVRHNAFVDNAGTGVDIGGDLGCWVEFTGNRIEDNRYGGLDLYAAGLASGNRIQRNRNGGTWVAAREGQTLTVSANLVRANQGRGLYAGGAGTVTVAGNRILENTEDGLVAGGPSTTLTLSDNRVMDNGHQGISNRNSATTITDNLCSGNGGLLGPDIAGAGNGNGSVAVWSGNTGLGGPDTEDRL